MYKGWIICPKEYQELIQFNYEKEEVLDEILMKFLNCEILDEQLETMKINWFEVNTKIRWDLKKKVNEAFGIKEGDIYASIINENSYFFNKYTEIYHRSILKTWKDHNGLYVTNKKKYIYEGYSCMKGHITNKLELYDNLENGIFKDTHRHQYDIKDIDNYIKILEKIKNDLIQLRS